MDAEGTELTQAVFATDDVVSVPIPYCLDWFDLNLRGSSSQGRFSGQVRHRLQELLTSESTLLAVSVGGHSFWHFISGDGADDNDGNLREAFANYVKKLKP